MPEQRYIANDHREDFMINQKRILEIEMYMPEPRYSANDHRKDFMINYKRSPEIEPKSPDSQSKALPIELARRLFIAYWYSGTLIYHKDKF
jgi:hypothetical protein